MNKIILATSNLGKIREIQPILKNNGFIVIPQMELGISDIEETGLSFVENALIKARHAAKITNLPTIADDSGLEVVALDGKPGIYSARYAGKAASSKQNIEKLLTEMSGKNDRKAFFRCAMVYLRNADDASPIICQSTWEGSVLFEPQGTEGFSYDPIFYVTTHHCSSAQLNIHEKNIISHRGKALSEMIKLLLLQRDFF